jgi:hypothetical protein
MTCLLEDWADPNHEPGFSKSDPQLTGGQGTDYASWMATARLKSNSPVLGRGARGRVCRQSKIQIGSVEISDSFAMISSCRRPIVSI